MSEESFYVYDNLNTPAEEAYKVLRTNVQFCSFNKVIKTIAITSCNSGEGKTTTSINLAISLARAGVRVLLIDADLRKPMTMKRLGSSVRSGLSNLISGYAKLDDVINKSNVSNLYYIACGPKPPNPAELLATKEFGDFLQVVREQFDIVLIDTPPLGSVIDCAIIAAKVDGTLLVICANQVEHRQALRVKEQLGKVNANLLGVILNKMKKSQYKSYYNFDTYYGDESKMKGTWRKNHKGNRKVTV